MQKSSLLKNSQWVQSPIWPDVYDLLNSIRISDSYYQRGTGAASYDLEDTINLHRKWVSSIIDLSDFSYAYVTSGATEAINHWRMSDRRPWQYFEGEYQWPQMISGNGVQVEELLPDHVLYISNPRCYDGNIFEFDNIDVPIILDCAYISSTPIKRIVAPVNTEQVMFSFSKGFGLIGQRCGLVYTKKPHPTLHPLKKVECFNYSAAIIMKAIMNKFTVDEMYHRYKETQKQICWKYDLNPSDTYFIGTSTDDYYQTRRRYRDIARLCITGIE